MLQERELKGGEGRNVNRSRGPLSRGQGWEGEEKRK